MSVEENNGNGEATLPRPPASTPLPVVVLVAVGETMLYLLPPLPTLSDTNKLRFFVYRDGCGAEVGQL